MMNSLFLAVCERERANGIYVHRAPSGRVYDELCLTYRVAQKNMGNLVLRKIMKVKC